MNAACFRFGAKCRRFTENTWNTYTWRPALAKAGVIPPRAEGAKAWQWAAAPKDGFHVLRHTSAHLRLDHAESRRVRRDLGAVARTFLASDHSRLLCSLHAGGRQQGARHHRRSAWEGRGIGLPAETPQILPSAVDRRFPPLRPAAALR